MRPPSKLIGSYGQDVWSIFSPLAVRLNAVNLGQGFPNFKMPQFMKQAASDAVANDVNQYSPPKGLPRLRNALAQQFSPLFGRQLDAENEIIITAGANEGMLSAFMAYLDRDTEVICFEPFFDQYSPNIEMCGAKMVCCPLRPPDIGENPGGSSMNIPASRWQIDFAELESKITQRTRMIVLNTPHNPSGKVFEREELCKLAELAIKYDLIVLSDEVYDRLVYDGQEHIRIATLPGMWERTLTVGSAGKSFCATGWRVGWLIGPRSLVHYPLLAHSRIVFCTNSPLQDAVAAGLESDESNVFFQQQIKDYQDRRNFLVKVFTDIGLPVTVPAGSYFILVNIDKLQVPDEELRESEKEEAKFFHDGKVPDRSRDWKICRWMATHVGVAAIPPSEFYSRENAHLAESYARFCFCKTSETLQAAKDRLQILRKYIK